MIQVLLSFAAALLLLPAVSFAQCGWGWGHMGWGGGWFMGLLFLVLLGVGVYYLIKAVNQRGPYGEGRETAMDILKKRYAKGEISREEFERMKKDLES